MCGRFYYISDKQQICSILCDDCCKGMYKRKRLAMFNLSVALNFVNSGQLYMLCSLLHKVHLPLLESVKKDLEVL